MPEYIILIISFQSPSACLLRLRTAARTSQSHFYVEDPRYIALGFCTDDTGRSYHGACIELTGHLRYHAILITMILHCVQFWFADPGLIL